MDFPSEVTLRVGEELQYSLPGAGSVGYLWMSRVEGPEGVISFRFGPSAPPRLVEPGAIPEAGSVGQTLTLRGMAPGRVKLHIELRRPRDEARPPRLYHAFEVLVL